MDDEDLSVFEEEDFKKNLSLYENMLQGGSSAYLEADELTDIAEYYMHNQCEDKALACIDYALKLHPESTDPQIFLTRHKLFTGDWEGALKVRQLITDRFDREVMFLDAEILLHQNKVKEASDFLMERTKEVENPALFIYDTTNIFIDYCCYEEALKWAQLYQQHKAQSPKCKYLFADIYAGLVQTDKSKEYINLILDENPYSIKYWLLLADQLLWEHKYNEAIDACDFALAIDKDNEKGLVFKVGLLVQLRDFDKAKVLLARICKLYPQNEAGPFYLGCIYNNEEQYMPALTQLEKALKLASSDSTFLYQIHLQMSFAYSGLRNMDEAINCVDLAYKANPAEVNPELIKGHIQLDNGYLDDACISYYNAAMRSESPYETFFTGCVALCEYGYYIYAYSYIRLLVIKCKDRDFRERAYPYLALCCVNQARIEPFLHYLKLSCECNLELTADLLRPYFAEDVKPEDYYTTGKAIVEKIKNGQITLDTKEKTKKGKNGSAYE